MPSASSLGLLACPSQCLGCFSSSAIVSDSLLPRHSLLSPSFLSSNYSRTYATPSPSSPRAFLGPQTRPRSSPHHAYTNLHPVFLCFQRQRPPASATHLSVPTPQTHSWSYQHVRSYLGQVILPILALVARNSLEQRPVANETTRVLRGLYDNTSSACSRYIPRTAGMPTIALPWGNHARPEIADSRRHPALRICPCKRLASGGRLPHPKGAEHVSLEDHSLARATTNAAHMHSRAELS